MTSRVGEPLKRVSRACDRCKVRKLKCSNTRPCERCELDQAVCHTGIRSRADEKPVSHMLVALAEEQQAILVRAVRELWNRHATAEDHAIMGPEPSIHDIVKSLGILDESAGSQFTGTDSTVSDSDSPPKRTPRLSDSPPSEYSNRSRSSVADLPPIVDPTPFEGLQVGPGHAQTKAGSASEFFAIADFPCQAPTLEHGFNLNELSDELFNPAASMDIGYPPDLLVSHTDLHTMEPSHLLFTPTYGSTT